MAIDGTLAVASDGTVYEYAYANATCAVSIASVTVFGRFFESPPVSPIVSAFNTGIGFQATLANGDMWMLGVSCCTPCYRKGQYMGNIFTVAGAATSAPDEMGTLAPTPESRVATAASGRIEYQTPRAGAVEVQVFDVQGRLVWSARSEHGAAGRYSVAWNSKDVASGIYFAKVQLPDGSMSSNRLVVAR